jgi:hypothetical protein
VQFGRRNGLLRASFGMGSPMPPDEETQLAAYRALVGWRPPADRAR